MTEINRDVEKFDHYRYGVEVRLIPKGGDEEDTILLTEALTELRIIKHYDEQVMPYFRMNVAVSVDEAHRIVNSWRDGKVYLTMKTMRALKGEKANEEVVAENTGEDYLKNGELRILVCDGAPPHVPTGQNNDLARQVPSVQFAMELAPSVPLDINKTINNGAFHEVTIGELTALLAADCMPDGKPDYKFVMSPPDNTKRYESIFVPPLNFVPAVRHIDSVYGLYSGKLSVFMDVDRAFILSSTKASSAAPTEPKMVMLESKSPEEGGPDSAGTGSFYDPETLTFRLRTSQRITAAVDGPANRESVGESIKLVRSTIDERTGSNCKNLTTDDKPAEGKKKERVAWQCYDNPLTADRLKIEARENYAPAAVSFSACDLRAFSPNLQWTLVTDSQTSEAMEGQWRLRATEFLMRKAPGTNESCAVEVMAEIVPAVAPTTAA